MKKNFRHCERPTVARQSMQARKMHKRIDCVAALAMTLCLFTACAGEGGGVFKYPVISNSDAAAMSDETLCYRYATARKSTAVNDEVKARNLDCGTMLENDPMYPNKL